MDDGIQRETGPDWEETDFRRPKRSSMGWVWLVVGLVVLFLTCGTVFHLIVLFWFLRA
jgi:hypothetical protein